MEDLKKYLSIAAKHSFWILTALVLILSTVFFYLTKTSLDESIASRKSALDASFKKIKEVSSKTPTHPNDFSHKEMERRLAGLQEDVERAWVFQYERQKEFLTWPTEAFFEPKTHEIFEGLRPFEDKVPFPLPDKPPPPLDSVTRNDRTVYKNYIAPEFPRLARRIGSSWKFVMDSTAMAPSQGGFSPPGGGGGFTPPGGGGFTPPGFDAAAANQNTRDLVRWSEDSQKALASAVLPWFGRATPPDIHEIYYAQEDIWILRGLMDIIAQTNAGANENFQAIVKEIEWIRTGPRASRDVGNLWSVATANSGGGGGPGGSPYGGGGPPAGYSGGAGAGMPSGYGGAGGPMGGKGGEAANAARAAIRIDPADGRYVDSSLKPLTGGQLRSAMKLLNATDAVNAVAKRVQVRMRLKVDERFGRLITECGNGKMMLEVLQVRYNTDPAPDAAAGGAGNAGGLGGGDKPSFGMGGGGSASSSSLGDEEMSLSSAGSQAAEISAGEVSIEIYGLIYLFNPPASLSKTTATAAAPAATAPATAAAPVAPSTAGPSTAGPSTAGPSTPPGTAPGAASNDSVETPPVAEDVPTPPGAENPTVPSEPAADESPTPPASATEPEAPAPPPESSDDGGGG